MPFSSVPKEQSEAEPAKGARLGRAAQVPPLWPTADAHFSNNTSFSVISPRPSQVRTHFGGSSVASTPRKAVFASRSPSSDETAGGPQRDAAVTLLSPTAVRSAPSSSLLDTPPPPPPPAAAQAADTTVSPWKQESAYGGATAWLVGASDEDNSSSDARGYGCGEGVSRTSSSASLPSPSGKLGAVAAVAVADPAAMPLLFPAASRGSSSFCGDLGATLTGRHSPSSHQGSAEAVSTRMSPAEPPLSSLEATPRELELAEAAPATHKKTTDATTATTSFVRAGMDALRTFTEQQRATQGGHWGPLDDPTGVRHTCGDCFASQDTKAGVTNASFSAPGCDDVVAGVKVCTAPPASSLAAGLPEARRPNEVVSFALERFSPFYKLAIKELILECERRVASVPAAVRTDEEAQFRRTVSVAAAASSVVGPRHALYRTGCGESCISTHSFDTYLRHTPSLDVLPSPTHSACGASLTPSQIAGASSALSPVTAAAGHSANCQRLQVPTLTTDAPMAGGKGAPMPLAHFPTVEEAARASFFGAPIPSLVTGSTGLSAPPTAAGTGAMPPLSEQLTLEALLKSLDHHIPYKQAAPMVFIGALAYLSRVASRCVSDFTSITETNWYRLTVLAVLTASKMYNEQSTHRLNRYFAAASGIALAEMTRLEVDFLYLLDFDLVLEERDVEEWLTWMEALALRHGMFASLNQFVLGDSCGGKPHPGAATATAAAPPTPRPTAQTPHHLHVRSGISDTELGSLLDSHVASPIHASEQRRHSVMDPCSGPTQASGPPFQSLPTFPSKTNAADDQLLCGEDAPKRARLFSVAHANDDPPTPPTLRELSRLADTPTMPRGGAQKASGPSGPPSPPTPSLFFARGSRGTSTTAGGGASSLHRHSRTASSFLRPANNTLAPSGTAAYSVPGGGGGDGNAQASMLSRGEGATVNTNAKVAAGVVHQSTMPRASPATDAGKGGRWGVMGRVKDVLGATASLVRGQLQVLASPAPSASASSASANRRGTSQQAAQRHPHCRDSTPPPKPNQTAPQLWTSEEAGAGTQDPYDADGFYDEQGCFHFYEDEGFFDEDGCFYFFEDVGYYDDDGQYHYYEDEGYYDEDGNFYFYDEEEEEDEGFAEEYDEDDEDDRDEAFFQRCRPPARLSPPSL